MQVVHMLKGFIATHTVQWSRKLCAIGPEPLRCVVTQISNVVNSTGADGRAMHTTCVVQRSTICLCCWLVQKVS
jgi:hypothetical protein